MLSLLAIYQRKSMSWKIIIKRKEKKKRSSTRTKTKISGEISDDSLGFFCSSKLKVFRGS